VTYQYALIDFGSVKQEASYIPGVPKIVRNGFFQWSYGTGYGDLQPLNFQQNIVFPEAPNAVGGLLWTPSWNSWTITPVEGGVGQNGIATALGAIHVLQDNVPGFTTGVTQAGSAFAGVAANAGFRGPATNGNQLILLPSTTCSSPQDPTNSAYSRQWLWLALALACDIAQATCMANAAVTTSTFNYPADGNQLCATDGFCRNATIQVTSVPSDITFKFGATGALKLGWYAWEYDGWFGPLHNINSQNVFTVPEQMGATCLYLNLAPPLTATVTLGYNPEGIMSQYSTAGEINLLANILSGLGI
jgi:hypothetical protein